MKREEKIYTGLCILFSVLIVLGNLIYQKFATLTLFPWHTFEISVGAILYPLTYLITDLIAEFYGKEKVTFCVRTSIGMNIIVVVILSFMDQLPATPWSKIDNATFHHVFGLYGIAFLGSVIACYLSQLVDIFLYLSIRKMTQGKYLWLRNNVSTSISLLIDTSIVVGLMTLFGVLPKEHFYSIVGNSYSWKLFLTICCTPIFYVAVFLIRRAFLRNSQLFPSSQE
ncbi:MAG: queuosine precursor transporter [Chthoniobacterales bacterium]|nr:queuosine precursor transporter [Chthoniobacterales bacterium]